MAKRQTSIKHELFGRRTKGVDKILIFRFFRLLHGRFWGLGSLTAILLGAGIGYVIRPDLLAVDVPLSRLGTDVRTAPFFAGSMFFAAYSLWRWRIYLAHTMKNERPVLPLISLSILGMYLIALMPVTWEVWPSRLHDFGVFTLGISMLLTVSADVVLTQNRKNKNDTTWKIVKLLAFLTIMVGGVLVTLSLDEVQILNVILLGEGLMFIGYAGWVILKVALGEGKRSAIGRIVHKLLN